jgi:hypothetical protein
MNEGHYWDILRPLFDGRKVISAGGVLAGSGQLVDQLKQLGATDVFVLADTVGTGDVPTDVPFFDLDIHGDTAMETIRGGEAAAADLPASAVTALSRFDPDGTALVLGTMFNSLSEIAGRRALAYRRLEWVAIEDKITIDARWDRWGVPRPPSLVVAAREDDLRSGAERLDQGAGTVWAGDAREGWNGGAEYTRWVRNDNDAASAATFFSAHCDVVRITPFLEGVPCSIHAIVFDEDVSVFRPMELVTLRSLEKGLVYAGLASFWDPSPADREAMRDVGHRAAAGLRRDVGYRGAFTVDGVMTVDGFRPTELNSRAGGGLSVLGRALPDLPLLLLLTAISGGAALDYRPRQLEELVVQTADATRAGGTWRAIHAKVPHVDSEAVMFDGARCRPAAPGEQPHGRYTVGPAPMGSFVRLTLDAATWPAGPHVGPTAAAFWNYLDDRFATGMGDLEAAIDVRRQVPEAVPAN